jgi:photosystem II stability/assembly factor-like uncharacterized protein
MRRIASFAVAAALLVVAASARANGRFPAANQLVADPTDASRMVLRTTFGFLLTKDNGSTWDWICERSVGYGGTEDPAIGILSGGSILAGLFDGLAVSRDVGCSWSKVGGALAQQVFIDVAVRRGDPKIAVALASTFKGQSDAGDSLFNNLVFLTTDGGATWNPVGQPLADDVLTQTIDFAESDATRLYVSGVRDRGTTSAGVLLVSSDGGATWNELPVPLDTGERAPFIAAVDPADAARIYVRTSGTPNNRLLYSEDAGRSFKVAFTSDGPLLGFALSPEGSKVFVGSQKDGLHVAAKADMAFKKRSDIQVQCLMTSGNTLWACSNMISGFILGSSPDDGATFTAKLKLDGTRGPLACPVGTTTQMCESEWPAVRDRLGASNATPSDAGARDAGSAIPPPPEDTSSCSTTGTSRGAGAGLVVLAAALALVRGRAAKRR